MAKYIYYNDSLRCKVSKDNLFIGEVTIQPQKKVFIFWVNCFKWMVYSEREKSDNDYQLINPMRLDYQFGNEFECWDKGSMTLAKRCELLIKEYLDVIEAKSNWDKEFNSL